MANTKSPEAKKNIIVIYGGRSGEHEVSIRSAISVVQNLSRELYTLSLIGITKNGLWYYQPDKVVKTCLTEGVLEIQEKYPVSLVPGKGVYRTDSKNTLVPVPADVFFPVLHGTFGEDGTIQGLFDMMGIPYVGSGVLSSSLCMDKEKIKQIWEHDKLPIIPFKTFFAKNSNDLPNQSRIQDLWRTWTAQLGEPLFVKPARAGSSVGISKVFNAGQLETALELALSYDTKVIIESAMKARELECSVVGNLKPRAFVPGEVVPHHEFYDYEAKYIDPNGAALLIPAPIPEDVSIRVRDLAIRAYRSAHCRGLGRVDFFYHPEKDALYLNELNTMPGFTSISMFSKMCEHGGLSYPELLSELISYAEEEFRVRSAIRYSY